LEKLRTEILLDFMARLGGLQDLDALVRGWVTFQDLRDSCFAQKLKDVEIEVCLLHFEFVNQLIHQATPF